MEVEFQDLGFFVYVKEQSIFHPNIKKCILFKIRYRKCQQLLYHNYFIKNLNTLQPECLLCCEIFLQFVLQFGLLRILFMQRPLFKGIYVLQG